MVARKIAMLQAHSNLKRSHPCRYLQHSRFLLERLVCLGLWVGGARKLNPPAVEAQLAEADALEQPSPRRDGIARARTASSPVRTLP